MFPRTTRACYATTKSIHVSIHRPIALNLPSRLRPYLTHFLPVLILYPYLLLIPTSPHKLLDNFATLEFQFDHSLLPYQHQLSSWYISPDPCRLDPILRVFISAWYQPLSLITNLRLLSFAIATTFSAYSFLRVYFLLKSKTTVVPPLHCINGSHTGDNTDPIPGIFYLTPLPSLTSPPVLCLAHHSLIN